MGELSPPTKNPRPFSAMHALLAASISANFTLAPVLALVAGILILVRPKLLNLIVAIYLIAFGLITIFNLG